MDFRTISMLSKAYEKISKPTIGFGRRWVAVIGIDLYPSFKNDRIHINPLDTAVHDAQTVQKLLVEHYGYEPLIEGLFNKQASPEGFRRLFKAMRDNRRIGPQDQVIIYFAGHGIENAGGSESFWIPYLEDENDYSDDCDWVTHNRIKRMITECPACQVLLVSDSCYSQKLTERGVKSASQEESYDTTLLEIAAGSRVRAVLTSGSREPVLDRGGGGHSVFCNHFLDLLKRYPGSCLPIGDLTYAKLCHEVIQASERLGKRQTPRMGYLTDDTIPFLLFRKESFKSNVSGFAQGKRYSGIIIEEEPLVGTLTFTFNVDNAQVDILGNRFSSKSGVHLRIRNIPVGRHLVQAGKAGYHDWHQEVEVLPDGQTEVSVNLEPMVIRHKSGEIWTDPLLGMPFVFVEGGSFEMGDLFGDGLDKEKLVHTVTLSDYWIGQYPVTFEEYDRYCGQTGSQKPGDYGWGRGRRPVINVSWQDAVSFAQWLSQKTGRTFRLPTEAEWEYAARSRGRKEKWSGTSDESRLSDYCWYNGNSSGKTHPVGEKQPNALGLYDMSGNVWEWCGDRFFVKYYSQSPRKDPPGPDKGPDRVYRGGSWFNDAGHCRVSDRSYYDPASRNGLLGFRLVLASGH